MSEEPIVWSPTEMIGRGWEKVKAKPIEVVLPLFVVGLVERAPGEILNQIAQVIAEQSQKDNDTGMAAVSLGLQLVAAIVNLLLSAFFTGGVLTFLLKVARGQAYSFGDVFNGGRYFGTMLLTLFLFDISVAFGLMLCIVPGVILALGWSFATLLVVDKNLSTVDAFKESWRLTTGHKVNIFVYGLLSFFVALLGLLVCCVGVIPASVVIALGQVFIYERLNSASFHPSEAS